MTDTPPFRLRQDFLSPAESAFYRVLHEMVKEHFFICPKVPLQDLFFVTRPNENVHQFNKIYRKNVDFLLLRRDSLKPAFAIALDYPKQAAHRPRDEFMENLFASANLPLVHVLVRQTYDVPALAAQFRDALKKARLENPLDDAAGFSPVCPHCGITMVLRFYKDGPKKGQQYYGCLNFPACVEVVSLR
jgi:hypothetical protein